MILSRVRIDPRRKSGISLIYGDSEDGKAHGCVESCFKGGRKRRLWRIDRVGEDYYMLIISEDTPDLSPIESQYGYKDEKGKSISYDGFLNMVKDGTTWYFRIVANPVKYDSGLGKLRAHVSAKYAEEWFIKKAESNGFEVKALSANTPQMHSFRKRDGNNVRIVKTAFSGTLTVTDSEKIKNALVNGIGKGKAYGAGMLTLIAPRHEALIREAACGT